MGAVALGVLLSRVLLIPDGPWEQDEALLALGVIDLDVARHAPHPPGFPGFVALGKVVAPLCGDALLALRLVAIAASVATVVLLAALLTPLCGFAIALGAAALYSFLPGVWFHAPRAFTTTPAIALGLLALWLWRAGTPRRDLAAWAVLGGALLVRPQLLLVHAVLAAAGMEGRSWRRIVGGVALVAAIVMAGYGALVVDTGGWAKYLAVTRAHLLQHGSAQASRPFPDFADLGFVRSLGGPVVAWVWMLGTVAGVVLSARGHLRRTIWLVVLLAVCAATVLWAHHPGFPRYCLPMLAASLPFVAITLRASRVGLPAAAVATVAGLIAAATPMAAAHRTPLPLVAALRHVEATAPTDAPVVASHGSMPFVRHAARAGHLRRDVFDVRRLAKRRKKIGAPFSWLGPGLLPGATVDARVFDGFPRVAWDLSQRRFDRVDLIRGAVLPGKGVHAREHNTRGEPFTWLDRRATLYAQPGAEAIRLVFHVDEKRAPVRLAVRVGKKVAARALLDEGLHVVRARLPVCRGPCPVKLRFDHDGDAPELAARLYGAWCDGEGLAIAPARFGPGQPFSAAAHGVDLDGFTAPERFTAARLPGAWTNGHARMTFPARKGTLYVTLAQPPPRDPNVTLRLDGHDHPITAGADPSTHALTVAPTTGRVTLEILGEALAPNTYSEASTDPRPLGPIVFDAAWTGE